MRLAAFLKAAPARCGLVLGALALSGCGQVHEEALPNPYAALSSPAGTILFLNAYRTRNCSWFECGESSFKYLGASVEAVLLHRGADGAIAARRLGRIQCDKDDMSACEPGNLHPQLLRGPQGPELVNALPMVSADTLAFSAIHGPPVRAGSFLCSAASLAGLVPPLPGVEVIKVMPDAALQRVSAVFYTRAAAPGDAAEAARCAALGSLPHPEDAPSAADVFLADVVRGPRGQLVVTYQLVSTSEPWARPLAMRAQHEAGVWAAQQLDETARGENPSPLFQPAFFDSSAREVLLDIGSTTGGQVALLLADRDGTVTRPPPVTLPR